MTCDMSLIQTSSQAQGRALTTDDASPETSSTGNAPAQIQKLEHKVWKKGNRFCKYLLILLCKTPKTNAAGTQQPAEKRRRRKRLSRAEDADANAADAVTTSLFLPDRVRRPERGQGQLHRNTTSSLAAVTTSCLQLQRRISSRRSPNTDSNSSILVL
jgi:hypothetical protein